MNTNHHKDKDNDYSINPFYVVQHEDWQVPPVTVSTLKAGFDSLSPLLVMNPKEELLLLPLGTLIVTRAVSSSSHSWDQLSIKNTEWGQYAPSKFHNNRKRRKYKFGFILFVFRPNPRSSQRSLREKITSPHLLMLHSSAVAILGIKGETQVYPIRSENSFD